MKPIDEAPRDGRAIAIWSPVWKWHMRLVRWHNGSWWHGKKSFMSTGDQNPTHFRLATAEEIELDEGGKTSRLPDLNLQR